MGYRFNDSGAGSDSCPPGMERTLAKDFCSNFQCLPDDIEVREGAGNNAGRHFLLIRNAEVALRALQVDADHPSSDELVVLESGQCFVEGRLINVEMQRRERSPEARQACLAAHGFTCFACGTNIKARYRGLPVEVIHVHHEEPLSQAQGEREFDPVVTMKPLCPNCHCVVHSKVPPYSVEEVRGMLRG